MLAMRIHSHVGITSDWTRKVGNVEPDGSCLLTFDRKSCVTIGEISRKSDGGREKDGNVYIPNVSLEG